MTADIHDFPKKRAAVTYGNHPHPNGDGKPSPPPEKPTQTERGPMRHSVQTLFERGDITAMEYFVLHRLVDYAGANDIRPSMAKLAGSRSTGKRIIASLEKKNLVEREHRQRRGGQHLPNRYRLKL